LGGKYRVITKRCTSDTKKKTSCGEKEKDSTTRIAERPKNKKRC
jgi:hypothetical protein